MTTSQLFQANTSRNAFLRHLGTAEYVARGGSPTMVLGKHPIAEGDIPEDAMGKIRRIVGEAMVSGMRFHQAEMERFITMSDSERCRADAMAKVFSEEPKS